MSGVVHSLCPDGFRRLAGGAAAGLHARARRAPTRAGWPRITTKTSTSSASCCPSGCTRISTTSTPTAAGRTIWATKSATRAESLRLLAWWRGELDAHVRGPRHASGVRRAAAHRRASTASREQPFADLIAGLRAGPDRHPLSRLGRAVRLLPVLGESGGPAGALSLRLFRRRAAAALATPPAPRCNSPISGRMSPWIC